MQTIHFRESNFDTGLLRFTPNRFTRAVRDCPKIVSIMPYLDEERERVVRFIEKGYRRAYGARVRVDYPNLISLRDPEGRLVAAAGFRFAGDTALFLEQYTDRPVEEILQCRRGDVVEIGNLITRGGGSFIFLFAAITGYFRALRIGYAALTCTASLERRFRRLGLDPVRVCAADPARLSRSDEHWGSYYGQRPCVLAGEIEPAYRRLCEIFGADFFAHRPRLFPRLHWAADGS